MSDKYTYKALDQNRNRIVKGTAQASNEYALEQMLSESNLALISFKKISKSALNFAFLERITSKDLVSFFIHLEQLEKAGVPLLDSLSDLKEFSDNQKIRDISADLHESVKGGKMLSEAMEKHKNQKKILYCCRIAIEKRPILAVKIINKQTHTQRIATKSSASPMKK